MEDNENLEQGPPRISFATFLLKILASTGGGIFGAVILIVIFLVSSSILEPLTGGQTETYISPIFVFVLMIIIFISTTASNLLSTFLLSLTERQRYKRVSSAIYQTFIVSIIMFLLMVPVYFITSAIDISIVPYAIGLHIILTAQLSALILEIVSNYKYALVGLYGITFSILVSAAILFGLSGIILNSTENPDASPEILLFIALPIVWGSIGFMQSIVTMIYSWFARTYDKDFLATSTVYGSDYGKEVEEEQEAAPKAQDEKGADFLRHN